MQETINNLEALVGISEWDYSIKYAAIFEQCIETIVELRDEMYGE